MTVNDQIVTGLFIGGYLGFLMVFGVLFSRMAKPVITDIVRSMFLERRRAHDE